VFCVVLFVLVLTFVHVCVCRSPASGRVICAMVVWGRFRAKRANLASLCFARNAVRRMGVWTVLSSPDKITTITTTTPTSITREQCKHLCVVLFLLSFLLSVRILRKRTAIQLNKQEKQQKICQSFGLLFSFVWVCFCFSWFILGQIASSHQSSSPARLFFLFSLSLVCFAHLASSHQISSPARLFFLFSLSLVCFAHLASSHQSSSPARLFFLFSLLFRSQHLFDQQNFSLLTLFCSQLETLSTTGKMLFSLGGAYIIHASRVSSFSGARSPKSQTRARSTKKHT
jgi:hypothetical protein